MGEARSGLSQEIPRENDVREGCGVEVPLPSFSGHLFQARHRRSQEFQPQGHLAVEQMRVHSLLSQSWTLSRFRT